MTPIITPAHANSRLEAIGRRRQWILDAEALFIDVEGGKACDLFEDERSGLAAEFDRVIRQMTDNGWACRVSGLPPRSAVCAACTAIGMTAASQRCPECRSASRPPSTAT
jgi:hypothetical protein